MRTVFILAAATIITIAGYGSTNPEDDFVKHLSDSIEIIALGDPSHAEGTITTARIALIRKLVLEKEFKVIAFESNLFQMYEANKEFISTGKVESIFNGMFGVFPCEEFFELFEFIKEQNAKGNPIEIIGFDDKFSGVQPYNNLKLKSELDEKILNDDVLSEEEKEHFYLLLFKIVKHSMYDMRINGAQAATLKGLNQKILSNVSSVKKEENKVLIQALNNISTLCDRLALKGSDLFNDRDIYMFENLKFIKDELFPGKKIILWGSSSHFHKNPKKIFNKFYTKRKNRHVMGEFVNKYYGSKYYFLAYSAINGRKTNFIYKPRIKYPSQGSLEYEVWDKMADTATAYLLNLNEDKNSYPVMDIPDVIPSRLFGHTDYHMEIKEVCDGMIFIKNVEPFVYLRRY